MIAMVGSVVVTTSSLVSAVPPGAACGLDQRVVWIGASAVDGGCDPDLFSDGDAPRWALSKAKCGANPAVCGVLDRAVVVSA
jgi:hypothetical protein